MIHVFAFYLFAVLTIASGAVTILARNPVHSVLWLILAFFNAAGLMVLVGAEFIAMLLVIVYVGAVAVLFLFVVMMLDIDFAELRAGFVKNFPLGMLVAVVLLAEIVLGIDAYRAGALHLGTLQLARASQLADVSVAWLPPPSSCIAPQLSARLVTLWSLAPLGRAAAGGAKGVVPFASVTRICSHGSEAGLGQYSKMTGTPHWLRSLSMQLDDGDHSGAEPPDLRDFWLQSNLNASLTHILLLRCGSPRCHQPRASHRSHDQHGFYLSAKQRPHWRRACASAAALCAAARAAAHARFERQSSGCG